MTISLEDAVNLLQEQHETIDEVVYAPRLHEYNRGTMHRPDLPAVFVIPRDGQWSNPMGIGCRSEDRLWEITVLVADTQTGVETEFFPIVTKLIDAFGELYNGTSINTASGGDLYVVVDDESPSDTGIDDDISYADTPYYGFQFTVRIWRKAAS